MKRIGFIAMSGVRAHNAELTTLGLTLPGFVDRNKIIASLPSLGLLTLAGLTPDKFHVEYHEIADLKKLPELPVDFDLVAISTFTAQFYEACEVADYYRAKQVAVVMGGITVSSLREQAQEHCTSVVVGGPKPFIEFADDNSFVHRGHYKELLRELARENVRWFTEADVQVAEDGELLGLLRDAGCQQVRIGFESPRRTSLYGVELKNNWKLRQQDCYRQAVAKIQSYGVTVNGCFILGLDGDTREVFDDVLQFVRESGLYEVQITFMTPFPGTPLYARLQREGRLLRGRAWELCTLLDINFQPKNMSVADLQSGFLKLAKQLYSAEETHQRRAKFKRLLKTSPNFGLRMTKQVPLSVN
jgi:radical SAM superfamily enzyme YgiQ (UPF0313 family)